MSLDSSLDNQVRLLAESRNFYKIYKPALANLQEKEARITTAQKKLAVAKNTLQSAQVDIEALIYFSIPGTMQGIHQHTQKLYEKQRQSLQKVQEYEAIVMRLLNEPVYIECKHTVEELQVRLDFFQSQSLFR